MSKLLPVFPKLNRAKELLVSLNDEVVAWKNSNPFEYLKEKSPDSKTFILGIQFINPPNLLRWGLLTGEILFNLRCALDHLIFLLAKIETGEDPPPNFQRLMFPITTSKDIFERKNTQNQIQNLARRDIEIIGEVQPFNSHEHAKDSPLFHIHELNNIDKHRYLHIAAFSLQQSNLTFPNLPKGGYKLSFNEKPLEEEDWLLSVETDTPRKGIELGLGAKIRMSLNEPNYRGEQWLIILKNCLDEANRVVGLFDSTD